MFFLYGKTTHNGKGTLMESILRVIGDYGRAVRPETITLKHSVNSQNSTGPRAHRKTGGIIQRLYQDNVEGKSSDERFSRMSESYEAEQKHPESRTT